MEAILGEPVPGGVVVKALGHVRLFVTPRTGAHRVPLSVGFPRQEYCSGLPCPSPGIFPTEGSNSHLLLGRRILYH